MLITDQGQPFFRGKILIISTRQHAAAIHSKCFGTISLCFGGSLRREGSLRECVLVARTAFIRGEESLLMPSTGTREATGTAIYMHHVTQQKRIGREYTCMVAGWSTRSVVQASTRTALSKTSYRMNHPTSRNERCSPCCWRKFPTSAVCFYSRIHPERA